jgi:hypothetical protein
MGQSFTESEQHERVWLRRLPAAAPAESDSTLTPSATESLAGWLRAREGARLTLELDPVISAHAVAPADLVEIRAGRILYLGQVRALRGLELTVILEHSVDLDLLDAIQRIWNRAPADGTLDRVRK